MKKKTWSNAVFLQFFTTGNSTLNEPNMFLCHFLRKKDSKSRTKANSFPGLIRAYVRTGAGGRPPNFLGLMDLPISMGMELRYNTTYDI